MKIKKNDKKQFTNDVVNGYNTIMHDLYQKWSKEYKPEVIRLEFLKIITNHITDKTITRFDEAEVSNGRKLSRILKLMEKQHAFDANRPDHFKAIQIPVDKQQETEQVKEFRAYEEALK